MFCHELAENSALYIMAVFMILIQFFIDHAASFVAQYRKYRLCYHLTKLFLFRLGN